MQMVKLELSSAWNKWIVRHWSTKRVATFGEGVFASVQVGSLAFGRSRSVPISIQLTRRQVRRWKSWPPRNLWTRRLNRHVGQNQANSGVISDREGQIRSEFAAAIPMPASLASVPEQKKPAQIIYQCDARTITPNKSSWKICMKITGNDHNNQRKKWSWTTCRAFHKSRKCIFRESRKYSSNACLRIAARRNQL